jgi:hypothetical protein
MGGNDRQERPIDMKPFDQRAGAIGTCGAWDTTYG